MVALSRSKESGDQYMSVWVREVVSSILATPQPFHGWKLTISYCARTFLDFLTSFPPFLWSPHSSREEYCNPCTGETRGWKEP